MRPADPTSYTPFFRYRGGQLHAEDVALDRIAARVGTPVYVYSRAAIESAWTRFDRAFASAPHMICYSVKANSNLSILRALGRLGSGFDIVSAGELDRLRRIGIPGRRIVFSGVGKTREDIRDALRYPGARAGRGRGAAGGPARILLVAGKPLHEPVARYGPFVMNTEDQIREAIVVGRFQPNERLVEASLAELTGAGRTSVRAALVRLDQEGLVVLEPNRGARVRHDDAAGGSVGGVRPGGRPR